MEEKKLAFENALQQFVGDFNIIAKDTTRAWGAFALIDEKDISKFIDKFFPDKKQALMSTNGNKRLSPKILFVAPHKRLSWQYHHRRSEIWRVLQGPVGLVISKTNEQTDPIIVDDGYVVEINVGIRHRLIGMESYGILAEIWQHIDPKYPSNEEDIVRVQDDFGR